MKCKENSDYDSLTLGPGNPTGTDPWKWPPQKAITEKLVRSLKAVWRFNSVMLLHVRGLSHHSTERLFEYAGLYQV